VYVLFLCLFMSRSQLLAWLEGVMPSPEFHDSFAEGSVGAVSVGKGNWRRQVDHISYHLKQYLQEHPVQQVGGTAQKKLCLSNPFVLICPLHPKKQEAMGRPIMADVGGLRLEEDDDGLVITLRINNPRASKSERENRQAEASRQRSLRKKQNELCVREEGRNTGVSQSVHA
jgi:hypothetical protein